MTVHNRYYTGTAVRVSGHFTDGTDDSDVDPTEVILEVRKPDGTTATYTYGEDDEVVRSAAGYYHADIVADQEGFWYYRWVATDQVEEETRFYAEAGLLG